MTELTTHSFESVGSGGMLSLAEACGLGILLAVTFVWLLWMQRHALGLRWASAFWCLRVLTAGLVLWMLLGPEHVTTHRSMQSRSVAVLVDTSDSMDVVDARGPLQIRWESCQLNDAATGSALACCDRAAVAIRSALRRSRQLQDAVRRHPSRGTIDEHRASIADSLARCVRHLEEGLSGMSGPSAAPRGAITRLLTLLQGDVSQAMRNVSDAAVAPTTQTADGLVDALRVLDNELGGVERRVTELSRKLVADTLSRQPARRAAAEGNCTRSELVVRALEALQANGSANAPDRPAIKLYRFDRDVSAVPFDSEWRQVLTQGDVSENPAASGDGERPTDLSAALVNLQRTADAESLAAAVLISDGGHNTAGTLPPQDVATGLGDLPVHVIPIGNTRLLRDVSLLRVHSPTSVVEDDAILIDVLVSANACDRESTALVLRKNGQPVDRRQLSFAGNQTDIRTSFVIEAGKQGRYDFDLLLEPVVDEVDATNNRATVSVDVVSDTLRVLLADRSARWEYRFLDQLFRRDPSITFDRILFEPDLRVTGRIASTGHLPRTIDGWRNYDVVILGDLDTTQLDSASQRSLDEFVRTGRGQLVLIAGDNHMPQTFTRQPLANLLPVERGRPLATSAPLSLRVTSAGREHPVLTIFDDWQKCEQFWNGQPGTELVHSLSDFCRPRATAESLLSISGSADAITVRDGAGRLAERSLVCRHHVGAGRVLYLAAPASYRLRLRQGDRLHHRFWGQLLRWLTAANRAGGTSFVRISTDRLRYEQTSPVIVTVRVADKEQAPIRDAPLNVTATSTDGVERTVTLNPDEKVPGLYHGSFGELPVGDYRLTPSGARIDQLLAGAPDRDRVESRVRITAVGSREHRDTRCDAALLSQIAEASGGQVVPATALNEIIELSAVAPTVSERVERQPLWNRWSLLWLTFGCLLTEWIVRKRLGIA